MPLINFLHIKISLLQAFVNTSLYIEHLRINSVIVYDKKNSVCLIQQNRIVFHYIEVSSEYFNVKHVIYN